MDYLEKYAQERLEKLKGMRRQCVANLKGLPEGKVYVKKKRKTNQFYKITPDGDRNGKYIKAGERDVAESLVKREYNEKCLNEIEKEIRALEKMLKTCNSENLENVISLPRSSRQWLCRLYCHEKISSNIGKKKSSNLKKKCGQWL